MESSLSPKSSHMPVNGNWCSQPCGKLMFAPNVQIAGLCWCEKLCVDMAITWHVVGYLMGMIFHDSS